MKNLTKENDNLISSFLTNNSLEHILHSTFKEYISELHLQNFKHIKEFNYDGSLILDMNTSSILYSFEKDDKVFYGLYIIAKSDYKIFSISYTTSANFFDKNLLKLETMIHSLKFNL
jgi:hypothetical protein